MGTFAGSTLYKLAAYGAVLDSESGSGCQRHPYDFAALGAY